MHFASLYRGYTVKKIVTRLLFANLLLFAADMPTDNAESSAGMFGGSL